MVHSALKPAPGQFDALATSQALQTYIHAKLVNGPGLPSARMGFLETDPLSNLPMRRRRRHRWLSSARKEGTDLEASL